jgi:hypothetical protein
MCWGSEMRFNYKVLSVYVTTVVMLYVVIAAAQDSSSIPAAGLSVTEEDIAEDNAADTVVNILNQSNVKPAAVSPEKTGEKTSVVREEDILIIEDDEEESILQADTVKAVPSSVEQASRDSSGQTTAPASTTGVSAESGPASSPPKQDGAAETVKEKFQKPAAVIADERSINFARNLKEYRSPKLALFLSLLVPGLGQAYSKKYLKTAIFGIAEAAIIGVGVNLRLKGKDLKSAAHDTADAYFSASNLWDFYNSLDEFLSKDSAVMSDSSIPHIKGDAIWDSAGFADAAASKSNSYYDEIGHDDGSAMVRGWKDCEPAFDYGSSEYNLDSSGYSYAYADVTPDTFWLLSRYNQNAVNQPADTVPIEGYIWGYSQKQQQYIDMIADSRNYYKISTGVFYLLVVNHVVSAIDAMITAKAHNDELLGKQSMWRRINLDQQIAMTDRGVTSTIGVRVRF